MNGQGLLYMLEKAGTALMEAETRLAQALQQNEALQAHLDQLTGNKDAERNGSEPVEQPA